MSFHVHDAQDHARQLIQMKAQPSSAEDQLPVREFDDKRQLAARLGVCVRTIDNLMLHGLPHIKLTRKLTRFPRGPVDEWLAERQVRRA